MVSSALRTVASAEEIPTFAEKKCLQSWFVRHFFILSWIKTYNYDMAISDCIAGVTLGLTLIPQSIAYAALAGLSPQIGLFSSFAGCLVYVIFGTIPQVSIGPTSLMALLTLKYTHDLPFEYIVLLTFTAGIVELLMGVLNLGFVVNFISKPVTSAFTTGTSAVIIIGQMKNLLGIKTKDNGLNLINLINQVSLGDLYLGLTCIVILIFLRQVNKLNIEGNCHSKRILRKFIWFISISRNALVVFGSCIFAYQVSVDNERFPIKFALSKKFNSTWPSFEFPKFNIKHGSDVHSLANVYGQLGSAVLVVPIVGVLSNVAIAKAFVKGSKLDASQEMIALGICNIAGSFFGSMPTCGAFTRSAVSEASGVRTPLAGAFTGGLVLLGIRTLSNYFEYIPKATLSAVLISAVIFMMDFNTLIELGKKKSADYFIWIGVFCNCVLLGVEVGLLFGVILSFLSVSARMTQPKIDAKIKNFNGKAYVHITPCSEIYYTGADHFGSSIISCYSEASLRYPVIINCQKLQQADLTILTTLKKTIRELQKENIQVSLQNVKLSTKKELLKSETNLLFC